MSEDHQLLVIRMLFTEKQVKQIQNNREFTFRAENLTGFGWCKLTVKANLPLSTAILPLLCCGLIGELFGRGLQQFTANGDFCTERYNSGNRISGDKILCHILTYKDVC